MEFKAPGPQGPRAPGPHGPQRSRQKNENPRASNFFVNSKILEHSYTPQPFRSFYPALRDHAGRPSYQFFKAQVTEPPELRFIGTK